MTFKKVQDAFTVAEDEKLVCVICFGYGVTQGSGHKIKDYKDVCDVKNPPDWFENGVDAALLAPTALNQQKFKITLTGDKAQISRRGLGIYTKIDLGIVKYHFEVGSGRRI